MNINLHYKLTSSETYKLTIQVLSQLPLVTRGRIKVTEWLAVLVYAAAFRISPNQAHDNLPGSPTSQMIMGELTDQLQDIDQVEEELNDKLTSLIPKKFRKKNYRVGIDTVKTPFHGEVDQEYKDEVCRSKAQEGTTHFFIYATAYAIIKGRRYTLALYRVRAGETMDAVVKKLLRRLRKLQIKIKLLLLDRGFYSVKVIAYLIRRRQPFIMPAVIRGKSADQEGGPTGTRALAQLKISCWTRYTLKDNQSRKVSFDLAVVCHNCNGKFNRHQRQPWLYVTWGLKHRPLFWIRETYRTRFGIESSYRQMHQARIKTATRNPILRLFFIAIALILRNLWVWLHSEVIALPHRGNKLFFPFKLSFQRLLSWLLDEVSRLYPDARQISVPNDLSDIASAFGLNFNY